MCCIVLLLCCYCVANLLLMAVQMKECDLVDALRQADVELKHGQTIQDVRSLAT